MILSRKYRFTFHSKSTSNSFSMSRVGSAKYLSISSTLAVFREEERSAKMSLIPVSGVVDVPSLSPELGFWLEMADHIPEARTFDGLEWEV